VTLVKNGGSKKSKMLQGREYVVSAGDTVRKIAEDLDVEPWQILDRDRKILQWPGALNDIRPLVAGEELFVTSDRFVKVMESGATNFDDSSQVREEEAVEDFTFPDPHPAVEGILAHEVYSEYSNDLAPFGSDEGWDAAVTLMRDKKSLRKGLNFMDTLRLYSGPDFQLSVLDGPLEESADIDRVLVGFGFAFIWTRGEIDAEGLSVVEAAIRRQIRRFGDKPLLVGLLGDLQRVARG
jgi:hypothetical protein